MSVAPIDGINNAINKINGIVDEERVLFNMVGTSNNGFMLLQNINHRTGSCRFAYTADHRSTRSDWKGFHALLQ